METLVTEPTDARFRVMSLLVAMAVVSVFAALFGPIVRQLQPPAQPRVLVAWGIWLLAVLTRLGMLARKRREAERLAGATFLQLPMFAERDPFAGPLWCGLKLLGTGFATTILLLSFTTAIADGGSGLPLLHVTILDACIAIVGIWCAVRIVLQVWWRNNVRFCQEGLLWDRSFLRWDHVVDTEWHAHDSALSKVSVQIKGIDQHNRDTTLVIRVPSDYHEKVQLILDLNVVQRPAAEINRPAAELGTIPLSAAIRDPRFAKYVATIVMAIWLIHFVRLRPAGMQEFEHSILLGLFLSILVDTWHWRRNRTRAGAPLIRLSARPSRLEITAFAATAAVLFAVGYNYGWSYRPIIAYVTGVGAGWSASNAIRRVLGGPLDLRENGVFIQDHFWPWSQVHATFKLADSKGRLVIAQGWRRNVAAVPPQQQLAVQVLLSQKLTHSSEPVAPWR